MFGLYITGSISIGLFRFDWFKFEV